MTLFVARWVIENPSEPNAAIGATITRAAKVYDLADRDRTQFLKKGMERLGTTPAPPT
jgi:hypothetical protein